MTGNFNDATSIYLQIAAMLEDDILRGVLLEQEAGAADLAQSPKDGAVLCLHEQGWEGGNCIFTHALTLTRVPLALLR